MNKYGMDLFFILGAFSAVCMMILAYVMKRSTKPAMRQAPVARPGDLQRRKSVQNPNIMCSLPMFVIKRPQQRLW